MHVEGSAITTEQDVLLHLDCKGFLLLIDSRAAPFLCHLCSFSAPHKAGFAASNCTKLQPEKLYRNLKMHHHIIYFFEEKKKRIPHSIPFTICR